MCKLLVGIICFTVVTMTLQASPVSRSTLASDRCLQRADAVPGIPGVQHSESDTRQPRGGLDSLVSPTNEWIDIYCAQPLLDGAPLHAGDTIAAYDADDIMCGIDTVLDDGSFGFMSVYRDDAFSGDDEGAEPGDTLAFRINGTLVVSQPAVVWTANGDRIEVCYFETQAVEVTDVQLDIKPGSCPNPLNVRGNFEAGKSMLPAAILGTEDFDVRDIDPASVTLEGVLADRWDYEDVATPVEEPVGGCKCTQAGPDGYEDLTLKFLRAQLVYQLGDLVDRQVVTLFVNGLLYDGTEFEGADCVVILGDFSPGDGKSAVPNEGVLTTSARPNPFNPSTEISFTLPAASEVRLDVYSVTGRHVATLVDSHLPAGHHTCTWNAGDMASGIYFYRIRADSAIETRKLVLVK
jgi:hypothetical protein